MARPNPTLMKALDPGIAPVVKLLMENDIETFESCQGGKGHCFVQPTIRFHGNRGTGFKVYEILVTNGLDRPFSTIRRYWESSDGELNGPSWEVTFYEGLLQHALKRRTMTRSELDAHAEATLSVL